MQRSAFSVSVTAAILATAFALGLTSAACARSETVLYRFTGGLDGGNPNGPLVADTAGNLYGTTSTGGRYGYGIVFKFSPPATPSKPWTETVLYDFLGGLDGNAPNGTLVIDGAGNLYGTSPGGGRYASGVVYRVSPPRKRGGAWEQTVLHSFDYHKGDGPPASALTLDGSGNIYGSSQSGGPAHRGAIFELSPGRSRGQWVERLLYTFGPCNLCGVPSNGMALRSGVLYGFTSFQVVGSADVAFSVAPPAHGSVWTFTDLHDFGGTGDGDIPVSVPLFDTAGNVYGTTESGGIGQCQGGGCGVVFELSPPTHGHGSWTETVLYTFTGAADGGAPLSSLVADAAGNLYGTTVDGGAHASGTAFELVHGGSRTWTEQVIHSFGAGSDGQFPSSGMIFGKGGALYGTTSVGGILSHLRQSAHGYGTLYSIGE